MTALPLDTDLDADGDAVLDADLEVDAAGPELALGLRRLIHSGEHLRDILSRQLGLGPTDLIALGHLDNDGPLTPGALASLLHLTAGSITTTLLDRIEQAGLASRGTNPTDRRSLLISITPAGHRTITQIYEEFDTALNHARSRVSDLSADQLTHVLTTLADALENHAQKNITRPHHPTAGGQTKR